MVAFLFSQDSGNLLIQKSLIKVFEVIRIDPSHGQRARMLMLMFQILREWLELKCWSCAKDCM